MRQNDEIQEFDLQVKSILENAEEKVPKGTWKAISSRMGQTAPARNHGAVWIGVAFACAASLMVGLFLRGLFQGEETEVLTGAPVAISSPVTAEQPVPDEPSHSAAVPVPAFKRTSTVKTASQEPCQVHSYAPAEPEKESSSAVVKKEEDVENNSAENWTDPFKSLPEERDGRTRNARRPSITIGGTLASNGKDGQHNIWTGVSGQGQGPESLVQRGVSTYGIPVSLGIGLRIPVAKKLSVGTGVTYSLLTTGFDASLGNDSGRTDHNMHYLGIPLNLYYDVLNSQSVRFYVYGGGAADLCAASNYRFHGSHGERVINEKVKGLQYSLAAGIGLSFSLAEGFELYMDPSVKYWFHSGHPESIRTASPVGFNFEAGLRFNL